MKPRTFALAVLLLPAAGCLDLGSDGAPESYVAMGFDGTHWPDLHGAKLVILDHGAFDYVFAEAQPMFEGLTNSTVEHIAAQDAGDALNRAIREKDRPSFDVVHGLDNALLGKAVAAGALRPYTPLLADRVNASYVFFDAAAPWPATPVDHGYIAVNVDAFANFTVEDFYDLREHADQFVTQDPRTSSPGLGFLIATIATLPEGPGLYSWKQYWRELLEGGALVTPDWTTAYATHFSGGYGKGSEGFLGDRQIVTSYTTSPAYEVYYDPSLLVSNSLVLEPRSTFHQIETIAIAAHAREPAAAEAWVEFTLTPQYQDLQAAMNAMYPVVDGIDVEPVFGGIDPPPARLVDAGIPYDVLTANVETWLEEWTEIYEEFQAGQ